MKLFLKKDVENLGGLGDVVEVKSGFARNYLIPHGYGVEVGQANLQWIEAQKRRLEVDEQQRMAGLQALAESVQGSSCTLIAKATEEGHLFGSVSDQDIADQLKADGIKLVVEDDEILVLVSEARLKTSADDLTECAVVGIQRHWPMAPTPL